MKIKINNEEVLCDKDFTINEEMLATSSVTLNNVYPKSWEETKDYVSNFYYPKDYSICKIYEETIIPYEPGTEVSGNPLYLTDVVASKIYQYKLYGYTKQTTYSGKNLLNSTATSTSASGVTITINPDKSVTLNGNYTGSNTYFYRLAPNFDLSAGTYTLSNGNPNVGESSAVFYDDGTNFNSRRNIETKTFTSTVTIKPYIRIAVGSSFSNFKIYPMIVSGSTAGNYEPYTGLQPAPNPNYPQEVEVGRGKNILKPYYSLAETTKSGVTYTPVFNDIGQLEYINVNGTATANSNIIVGTFDALKGKRYYMSGVVGYTSSTMQLFANSTVAFPSGYRLYSYNGIGNQVAQNDEQSVDIRLYCYNGTSYNNVRIYPMVCKIRDDVYKAYNTIEVKSTGKNLFDKNAVTTGKWLNAGGNLENAGNYVVSDYIQLEEGQTYYIPARATSRTKYYKADKSVYSNTWDVSDTAQAITIPTGVKYIRMSILVNGTGAIDLDTFQFAQSSTATPFEPYKETSIQYNLGDNFLADKDYIENGVLHHNIGKLVLTGTENFVSASTSTAGLYRYNLEYNDLKPGYKKALCNYFTMTDETSFNNVTEVCFATHPSQHLFAFWSNETSTNNFKTWLQTQYNNGNPVVVYYELAEETTIDLTTEGELSLYDGINNVSADTDFTIDMLYNRVNGEIIEDIIFNGLVKRTGNISLNPRDPHYCSLQVLDFKTFLSEGDVLNFVIANKTIEQAINMVVKAISSYGFVVGNIELDAKDDIIGAYSTDEKTAYDVFQYIADITNAKWFTHMIDEETIAIDFYDTDKLPNKGLIEYTDEWFCQNKIDDMSYSMDTNDYRNKQIILSDEVFGSTDYNETITATGYTTQFLTGGKIAKLNGATINSQTATIATNEEKEAGIEADIYYTPGENQFETAETQAQGIIIEVSYTPLVKGREIVVNNEEVDRISSQLNRNGVISRYENRNDTTSSSELQQIGQSYIKYKGNPEITLKIVSRSNLYNVGDQITFSSPLTELSTEYMVKKKSINYIATQSIIWYTFELSSNYNSESAINYFDNQRAKRAGNISESDYIIREIDINNTAQIKWKNTTITETTITGDNVLNAPLNAPLTQ